MMKKPIKRCLIGTYETDMATPLCLLSAFFLLYTASRIRFACARPKFEKDETYLEPEACPGLYAVAEKAANALSCSGKIHISTTPPIPL